MSTGSVILARHDLLAVAPADWDAVAATRAARPPLLPDAVALVARWGKVGWPVIARRRAPGDPPGAVPVGLALPPSAGKARVSMTVPADVGVHLVPGVALDAARAAAPPDWQATIDAALSLGASLGLVPQVFGALLWQSLTGMVYLHAESDIDILWSEADPAAIGPLLDGLARLEAAAPMRIDGEVLTSLGGVAWRELAAGRRGEVEVALVKSLVQTGFVPVSDLLAREGSLCP